MRFRRKELPQIAFPDVTAVQFNLDEKLFRWRRAHLRGNRSSRVQGRRRVSVPAGLEPISIGRIIRTRGRMFGRQGNSGADQCGHE
jgi:hypothetical protein